MKKEHLCKPKFWMIRNLVMVKFGKYKTEEIDMDAFEGVFGMILRWAFWYDVEGCEVHPKWPLALAGEFLANALFLKVQK